MSAPRGSFVAIAIHHAAPEHDDEMVAFMHQVVDATQGAPGLVDFKACRDAGGTFLAGVSTWESEEAFQAGLERIYSLAPLRRPEWTTKPDDVFMFVEL
jgi:quinol monooxygenase YgiN